MTFIFSEKWPLVQPELTSEVPVVQEFARALNFLARQIPFLLMDHLKM